jgi:hypothetical protein
MTRKRGSVKDAEISDYHQSINERIGAMDRPQMAEDKFAIEDNPQKDPLSVRDFAVTVFYYVWSHCKRCWIVVHLYCFDNTYNNLNIHLLQYSNTSHPSFIPYTQPNAIPTNSSKASIKCSAELPWNELALAEAQHRSTSNLFLLKMHESQKEHGSRL